MHFILSGLFVTAHVTESEEQKPKDGSNSQGWVRFSSWLIILGTITKQELCSVCRYRDNINFMNYEVPFWVASSLEQAVCVVTCQNVCKRAWVWVHGDTLKPSLPLWEAWSVDCTRSTAGHRDEEAVLSWKEGRAKKSVKVSLIDHKAWQAHGVSVFVGVRVCVNTKAHLCLCW